MGVYDDSVQGAAAAVATLLDEDSCPGTLDEAARHELVYLWGDLAEHLRRAVNGQWSVGCDNVVNRIVYLTRLIGATPWQEVQIPLLDRGVYQAVHRAAGIGYPPIDWDAVADVRVANRAGTKERRVHLTPETTGPTWAWTGGRCPRCRERFTVGDTVTADPETTPPTCVAIPEE